MITQRDIAVERLLSFTMWLQNHGLIDEKTELMLREDLQSEIDYYIADEPLTEYQKNYFKNEDEIAKQNFDMAMGVEGV